MHEQCHVLPRRKPLLVGTYCYLLYAVIVKGESFNKAIVRNKPIDIDGKYVLVHGLGYMRVLSMCAGLSHTVPNRARPY